MKSARWPFVMYVFEAVDDEVAAVRDRARADPGHVGAGVGLGDPQAGDLLAPDGGREVGLLLRLGAEGEDGRRRHVGVYREAHRQAAAVGVDELLGEDEVARVVAALAAVLLGHRQPEEPELAHAREDPVVERLLLPALGVRLQLLDHERVDRLAQALVLFGEDEVRAPGAVVGLEDGLGDAHGGRR
jgi:hypothetical protein